MGSVGFLQRGTHAINMVTVTTITNVRRTCVAIGLKTSATDIGARVRLAPMMTIVALVLSATQRMTKPPECA